MIALAIVLAIVCNMKSLYIKELHKFTFNEIKNLFDFDDNKKSEIFLYKMMSQSIVKVDKDKKYNFNFVGIVIYDNILIKCYPKYIKSNLEPLNELNQILELLKAMQKRNSKLDCFDMMSDFGSNNLSNIFRIVDDYYENGIYINEKEHLQLNGENEIYWDKTINDITPIISKNKPFYMNWFTRKTMVDENNIISKIHECILQECYDLLMDLELIELFDVEYQCITQNKISDLGDIEYISSLLQNEINNQYNNSKKDILTTLLNYISNKISESEESLFDIYGTNNFKQVWEDVCQKVLRNVYDTRTSNLGISINKELIYDTKTMKELIPKPVWHDESGYSLGESKETLEPDILTLFINGEDVDFVIFDAKYYVPTLDSDKKIHGYPGIADVTKQHLYELVYKELETKSNIKNMYNCFLMPTEKNEIELKGYVTFEPLINVGLNKIYIRFLSASDAYKKYLNNEYYAMEEFVFKNGM